MKHSTPVVLALALSGAAACGPKENISDFRTMPAPPREANCKLDMVQVDITSIDFNRQWDVLGFVMLADRGGQDPFSEDNKALVRPRACAMGGSSVAISISGTNTNRFEQQASVISYMVLRPKTWAQRPQAF